MGNLSLNQRRVIIIVLVVLLICIGSGFVYLLFFLTPPAPVPPIAVMPTFATLTPAPTLAPGVTPTAAPDPVWARIQKAGKMVVGTAGDYQPFSYYNADFRLDGFDVALITEIAKTMNIPIEIRDMAFDGLPTDLQLGQIDVAIAALSITPERQASLNFSNAYYASQDAYLASQSSTLPPVTNVSQLASQRVGVQQNSVFEDWLRASLVDTGLMPPTNLFVYPKIDSAIADLQAGKISVVVLDLPVATTYVQKGGVKQIGQNLNQQLYGIAMLKSAYELQVQINQALTTLQNNGTLTALTQKYFGQSGGTPPPNPTPPPAQPTPTPSACLDGMSFVADLNYPDYNMTNPPKFYPGEAFAKGWRLKNTGTCPWDINYFLVYVDGNTPAAQMGGQPTNVKALVAPNAQYDMYVNLVAPLQAGVYQGFWQMRNPKGQYFGQRIWVGIRVRKTDATEPPVAAPGIQQFSATPAQINVGQCVTVQWSVTGQVSTVKITRNNADLWAGAPVSGSIQDCPPGTGQIVYGIQATGTGGTTSSSSTVAVGQAPPTSVSPTGVPPTAAPTLVPTLAPPVINTFTAQPAQVKVGECATLTWNVSGNLDLIQLFRNGALMVDHAPQSGSGEDCYSASGVNNYRLAAVGANGQTVSAEQQVTVNPTGTTANLVSLSDAQGNQIPVLAGTQVTITFDNLDLLTGSAGCNTYSTSYKVSGNAVTIGQPIAVGRLVCTTPAGIMEQENQYISLLSQVNSFESVGGTLRLVNRTTDPNTAQEVVKLLLVFQQVTPR